MVLEYQTPIEAQLTAWAQEREFVVGERIWHGEIKDAAKVENILEEKEGAIASHIPKGLSEGERVDYIAKHAARNIESDVTVFKRNILIPTGVICYGFTGDKIGGCDLNDIGAVQKHIKAKKMHLNSVEWYLGHANPEWRSDKWPSQIRKEQALIFGNMLLTYWAAKGGKTSTSGRIDLGYGDSDDPFYNALTAMLDWNESPASRCGDLAEYVRKDDRERFGLQVTGDHSRDLGKLLVRLDKAIQSLS